MKLKYLQLTRQTHWISQQVEEGHLTQDMIDEATHLMSVLINRKGQYSAMIIDNSLD